jgi:serine/threonine protein kinase HipA of HipAB toxin-antitoxin module
MLSWLRPHSTAATAHIFKPVIGLLAIVADLSHSIENEYLYLKRIAVLGLLRPHAEIVTFAGTPVVSVERFDQRWKH